MQDFNLVEEYVYLGVSAKFAYDLENQLPLSLRKIVFNRRLAEIQYNFRDKYLEFIDGFEKTNLNSKWWQSRLSGKNPWVSKFYLRFCQLQFINYYLIERQKNLQAKPLLIVVDDIAIYDSLIKIFRSLKMNVVTSTLDRNNSWRIKGLVRRTGGLFKYFLDKFKARKWFGKQKRVKARVIGTTFTDSRSYRGNVYADPFIGNIVKEIKEDVEGILFLPIIFDFKANDLGKIRKWIDGEGHSMQLPIQFVSYLQIIKIYVQNSFGRVKKVKNVSFEGIDVSELINEERREEWGDYNLQLPILEKASKRIQQLHNPDLLIIPFENQLWERTLIDAFKKVNSKAKLIGFQNAPAPLLSLRYFNSVEHKEEIPSPDIVVVNGAVSFENFQNNFGKNTKLIKSSSSRVNATTEGSHNEKNDLGSTKIMVACSISVNESIELISFVFKAMKNLREFEISIVPHPLAHFDYSALLEKMPSSNIQLAENAFVEVFDQASIVVFDSSTVGLQAIQHNKRAINVCHSHSIHVNPNEYDTKISKNVFEPKELLRIAKMDEFHEKSTNFQVADQYFGFGLGNKTREIILDNLK